MRYPLGRNLEIQNFFALGPLGGVLWAFQNLANFGYIQLLNGHNLGSTNDRRLVLVSNMFWDKLSEKKNQNFFWAQKNHFLAQGGPFWVPVTPSTMNFGILTKNYHFYIKYMLESSKKTLGPCTNEGAIIFQNLLVWLFLAIFGIFGHIFTQGQKIFHF